MPKRVYFFAAGKTDGDGDMREILGGKGAGLAEMTNLGIPVPAGFTISTEVCGQYDPDRKAYPEGLKEEVERHAAAVENEMDGRFGDPTNPLLFSVRSGARVSMPGMMDTVLNLGLNDSTAEGLAAGSGNPRFAYDSYRRLVQMYGNVVMGVAGEHFEEVIDEVKRAKGVILDTDLTADDLKDLVARFRAVIKDQTGKEFPQDARAQLWGAISAVFMSWNIPRAVSYRRLNRIPSDWGTAVNVQAMVFGNMGEDSATGVVFTRNPSTGDPAIYGEYLKNAQGEDVVAGIRTPNPIRSEGKTDPAQTPLEEEFPDCYRQLTEICHRLEQHFQDMQDVEFTIQRGKLWMLQTRAGKRTARAAVRIAVDMVNDGLIDKRMAVKRVPPQDLDHLLHPMIDPHAEATEIARGLPASPGAVSGAVVFTAGEAVGQAATGKKVILARTETSPDDIEGMNAAEGILTSRGGMTSHAAVVARGMGKCCVVGAGEITIDSRSGSLKVRQHTVNRGDVITLDGSTGKVFLGEVPTVEPTVGDGFAALMGWADEIRTLGVRTNADTPKDAQVARELGAEGIGLCRTEHMFFGEERVPIVQEMILAEDSEARRPALEKLLPFQRDDFKGILKAMEGLPVTIRLLDPPLHEFLPREEKEFETIAANTGLSAAVVAQKAAALQEANPMLGHRGCRLGVSHPEIYEMQVRAIFEAACELKKEGVNVRPEVMIPLVGTSGEMETMRKLVEETASEVLSQAGVELEYLVGTMIEVPRAALLADQIALDAAFFSFGTNDLTQMTYGFSRDDVGKFLPDYIRAGILPQDPFQVVDQEGVGKLVQTAVKLGRRTRPDIKLGICGEHGGDPDSIRFFHQVGLDYVSCSPYRVPVARLAAAHAALEGEHSPTHKDKPVGAPAS